MSDLEKVLKQATTLARDIKELLKISTFDQYYDLSGLEIDYTDPEQLLLLDEFKDILDKLKTAKEDIDYLNQPIIFTGFLSKNSRERYETEKKEYRSGSLIEALIYDDFNEREHWVITSVEHDGTDYYLVHYKDVKLEGLKVRIRGN